MVVVSTIIMRLCSNGVEDNGEEGKVFDDEGIKEIKYRIKRSLVSGCILLWKVKI